jgi:PAS domain S-box-containing protein
MPPKTEAAVFDAHLFRDIFSASPIGIVVENLEGQPLFVNSAFISFLGFSQEELCRKHCVDFSPREDAEKDWTLFQQLRAGSIDHYQLEKRYFRRDGSLIWGQLSVSLLKDRISPLVVAMVEDITEKKKAEETRSRYATIVESSQDAIASATLDGVITTWNPGAERIFGYTASEAIGKSVSILVPPELYDEENKILETLRMGNQIGQLETVRITKAGKRIDVSLSISPIKDARGEVIGCSGIARDITDRKLTAETLRRSEERFRLAAHAGKMFAYEWDAATDLIVRSPESTQILGVDAAVPMSGQQVLAKVHPEDRERLKTAVAALSPERPYLQISYRMTRSDGTVIWVDRNSQAYFDEQGRILRLVGMVVDVTERALSEAALRESEEKFRTVFRDAGVGMVIISPEGRFLAANRTFCDCLGYGEEELLAKTVESITVPEDWPAFSQKLREALTEGRGFQWVEKRCLHQSGRIVYTESTASLIRNSNGEPQYFVGEVLDITQRKEAEKALSDITRKLLDAQEQERARIGRELHDDINQRLALLAVELEQLGDEPSVFSQRRAQELRKQIVEISNDVQALSHELHSSKLQYLGVVAGMRSWCKEYGERQKMEIDFSNDVNSPLPFEIGLSLFRILQEALHNAAKYSGVKRAKVQLREEQGDLHLLISDSGKGFDVESALRGKGLGLTSMRERARLANGSIAIESKPMSGTRVHVRVPFEAHSQRMIV